MFLELFRWKDITNVVNHKRSFGIECPVPDETVHFQFTDPESAKYVWRMCVHQVISTLCICGRCMCMQNVCFIGFQMIPL